MLVSHQIKKGLILNYKDYQLKIIERKGSSVTVENSKGKTYNMNIMSLMEDVKNGICEVDFNE